jgi:phage tail protein X
MSYNRYQNTKQLKSKTTDNRYLSTTIYSEITKNINDIYIISRKGDRLDLLAHQYYGDVTKWSIIARANHLGKGGMDIPSGLQIRIPVDIKTIETNDIIINK